ncbi:MAG TPA: citrate/2-methylcitrate synthase, partial [Gemmatimonadaceae bacterium]|nr:citrate/2-methylcitrate synthase [Gemmatimonadaceae bacterium]
MSSGMKSGGLEDVVAASTRLSRVDGEAGTLILAGYAVEDLASHATFEAVVALFLSSSYSSDGRALSPATIDVLRHAAARRAPPMDALL